MAGWWCTSCRSHDSSLTAFCLSGGRDEQAGAADLEDPEEVLGDDPKSPWDDDSLGSYFTLMGEPRNAHCFNGGYNVERTVHCPMLSALWCIAAAAVLCYRY